MADPVSWKVVEPGWRVVSSDGQSIGTVHEVLGDLEADIFDGLNANTGRLLERRYIPSEQVGEIEEGAIHLTIPADAVSELDPPVS
ncbi:MAG: DUF2171 domain-containing protein [Actinobacteria bacterium]|nr:DUF2171 domain-containing protein [Actinomycetota bacterium]